MNYWLMKSEPSVYSINDLKRDKKTAWEGVRNYQARNFMRDKMQLEDLVLFYHSNANPPGIAGIAQISKLAYPDESAWDKKSPYYDAKSSPEKPIWLKVDVSYVSTFKNFISLDDLKKNKSLADMMVLQKGSRLSVQPVLKEHFEFIQKLGN